MVNYTKEQIEQMTAEANRLREEIRKYYVSAFLQKLGLKGGDIIKADGHTYQVLPFDELCRHNDLDSSYMRCYGRLIKKDGNPGKNIQRIYGLSEVYICKDFKIIKQ